MGLSQNKKKELIVMKNQQNYGKDNNKTLCLHTMRNFVVVELKFGTAFKS
jgi:hypothetical protein